MDEVHGLHVIVGAGAIGTATARELAARGARVRVVTRRGGAPALDAVEAVAADASDRERLTELCRGAAALYNCANPPYHRWAEEWPPIASSLLATAEATGARLVTLSNLYMYAPSSRPLAEGDPLTTTLAKGLVRAAMTEAAMEANAAGRVEATEARASDFVGPGLTDQGLLGERVVPRLLAGRSLLLVGDAGAAHSWSYTADVAHTLVTLATSPLAPGRVWHVPSAEPASQREMVTALAQAAGVEVPPIRSLPGTALVALGLVSTQLRELARIRYQWTRPFTVDSSAAQAELGLTPTPRSVVAAETVAWWRARIAPDASRATTARAAA